MVVKRKQQKSGLYIKSFNRCKPQEVKFSLGRACEKARHRNWQAHNERLYPNTVKTGHVLFCDGLLPSVIEGTRTALTVVQNTKGQSSKKPWAINYQQMSLKLSNTKHSIYAFPATVKTGHSTTWEFSYSFSKYLVRIYLVLHGIMLDRGGNMESPN